MLAFIQMSINIFYLAGMVIAATICGFFISQGKVNKQRIAISKLEMEMLQNHAEILQLQKELSDKDKSSSKTPIFTIGDASELSKEQAQANGRLGKKLISGGGKS